MRSVEAVGQSNKDASPPIQSGLVIDMGTFVVDPYETPITGVAPVSIVHNSSDLI